jgi:integrase
MAKSASNTSITDTAVRRFLQSAVDRQSLACEKITGFHLLKIGSGASWRYRYTNDLGKRPTKTIGTYPAMKPDEAAQVAMTWRNTGADPLADKRNRKVAARTAEQISKARNLGNYLDGIYTAYQARKKSGTNTIGMIRNNFGALLDRDMTTICAADIKRWQAEREQAGLAHVTLVRAYGALRTLLGHAVREHIIDSNPIAKCALAAPTAEEKAKGLSADARAHRRMLTPDELSGINRGLRLFSDELREQRRNSRKHGRAYLPDLDDVAFPHWFIPYCLLAMHTGLRPGDLYTLNWQELNLNFRRLVKIPEKTIHHKDPAKLDLPLSDEIYEIMVAWHKQQGSPIAGLVFLSTVTDKPFDKQAHSKAWKRVLALGGLDPGLHFYSLRHHFLSALVASGAPMLAVAKLGGHKSASMIEAHYGHLAKNTAADLMQSFSNTLKCAPQENEKSS